MKFFDYITWALNDLESDDYRNIRWETIPLWEIIHTSMVRLRNDIVDVFQKEQEVTLARGTCYQVGICSKDSEGNPIDGSLIKVLMIDNNSCQRPKLTSEKEDGISDVLLSTGSYWGYGFCAEDCKNSSIEECLVEDEEGNLYKPYDWGGILLDRGSNNFWTINPTPTDRDVVALVRCSIIPSVDDIESWLEDKENFIEFTRVKSMLYELALYYAYEHDESIPERNVMMNLRMNNYRTALNLWNAKYAKKVFMWDSA